INAVEQKQTEVRQERDTLEQEFRNLQMTSQELDGMIKDYLKIQADLKKDLGSGKGEEEETKKTKKELNDIGKTLREAKLRNDSTLADIKKMTSMIEKRKKQLERNETELKRIKTQRTDTQSELDKGNRLIAAIGKQINELKLLLDK
ncbi:MAG TPA: hypothetical protein VHM26_16415, partial [Chitinophagaceae bacterium]|nr:hypothetical protein [Chitinophagaceae bacterium]